MFKVLVVDDSSFYRRRLRAILEEDRLLQVVGEAKNGKEAVELAKSLSPDVITMDVDMPVMDGIEAVRIIMKTCPTPILMFSSLTVSGAQSTLDALEAGALDFLPKKFEDVAKSLKQAEVLLRTKVRIVARRKPFMQQSPASPNDTQKTPSQSRNMVFMRGSSVLTGQKDSSEQVSVSKVSRSGKKYRCLAIGASTGGPVALQKILTALPANFPLPIIIVQHMPNTFTGTFAERLDSQCKIKVEHASSGQIMKPGVAYVAPGGQQCEIKPRGSSGEIIIRDLKEDEDYAFNPCVDLTFKSIAKTFKGDTLAIVLTGMGNDGEKGCETLKETGATIWAQGQNSCVVYGMPQAVAAKGLSSNSIELENIASCITDEIEC